MSGHSSPASHARRYASLDEAAKYLGVNERTIRRHIAAGRLIGYRLGTRLVRVDLNELDAMLIKTIPTAGAGGDVA
jgi:excisionase family DNA binding protein